MVGWLMALNQLIYGDKRSFGDHLKLVLDFLKYENVFEVGLVQPLQAGRKMDTTTKLAGTFVYMLFCWRVLIHNFCWRF